MDWHDVADLRRASSKSKGLEFFEQYKDKFIKGATEYGYTLAQIESIWNDISHSGSWSFNKSHAVSYALVSYWTAYFKCFHPLEFSCAYLNNADEEHGVKFLRDMVKHENLKYVPVDADRSIDRWCVSGDEILGPLQNIEGIGQRNAERIIKCRNGDGEITPSIFKKLSNPRTPYDVIFPTEKYFGYMYERAHEMGVDKIDLIENVNGKGKYCILGLLTLKNVRNLNETFFLEKRGGEIFTEDILYLNMKIEDDTDQINVQVTRDKYEKLGRKIAEEGEVDKDWYIMKGIIKRDEYRRLEVYEIVNINQYKRDVA